MPAFPCIRHLFDNAFHTIPYHTIKDDAASMHLDLRAQL